MSGPFARSRHGFYDVYRRPGLGAQAGLTLRGIPMCRSIKTLHNFAPPASEEEIHASSLQFVRKLAGFARPSKANEAAFNRAVDEVAHAVHHLLDALVTNAPPRDRAVEAMKARALSAKRFGSARAIAIGDNHN